MKPLIRILILALSSARLFGGVDLAALGTRAAAGEAAAMNELGAYYQQGTVVPKDEARALALYQRAADAGDHLAEYNLAFMYDMGVAVAKDRSLANSWYRKSADAGYAPAMLNLGMNVAGGEGSPKDFVEGMKWIDLARFFTQFEKDMQVKWRIRGAYDYMKKEMSKDELKEAGKRSNAWFAEFKARQKRADPLP